MANSRKLGERCIAVDTGKWIRPVCDELYPQDGRIPRSVRLVEGREPELLDILEIPLADTGNDFGFESENRSVLPGHWNCLGKAKTKDLLKYCGYFPHILHNSWKYVNPSYLQSLPSHQRRTIQLLQVVSFSVEPRWRGTIRSASGDSLAGVKITDQVFVEKLDAGYEPPNNCLVTVSLSLP